MSQCQKRLGTKPEFGNGKWHFDDPRERNSASLSRDAPGVATINAREFCIRTALPSCGRPGGARRRFYDPPNRANPRQVFVRHGAQNPRCTAGSQQGLPRAVDLANDVESLAVDCAVLEFGQRFSFHGRSSKYSRVRRAACTDGLSSFPAAICSNFSRRVGGRSSPAATLARYSSRSGWRRSTAAAARASNLSTTRCHCLIR
jgi:hypothetical protein